MNRMNELLKCLLISILTECSGRYLEVPYRIPVPFSSEIPPSHFQMATTGKQHFSQSFQKLSTVS